MRQPESITDRKSSHLSSEGFSLIEILVVVAVILIIAAIAIPNYMQSKMRANEASAANGLRTVSTADLYYMNTYGSGYAVGLLPLSGTGVNPSQSSAGLIDQSLASGTKGGYIFTYIVLSSDPLGNPATYTLNADPQVQGSTGQVHFYTDQTCVIRSNTAVQAGPGDNPIS